MLNCICATVLFLKVSRLIYSFLEMLLTNCVEFAIMCLITLYVYKFSNIYSGGQHHGREIEGIFLKDQEGLDNRG